jgi:hypothetical protein
VDLRLHSRHLRLHETALTRERSMKVAILDNFQNVALGLADWSPVARRAEITVFTDHLADPAAVVERLRPFDVVCVMRERTPLSRQILEQLPRLKLIASTGPRNASIDMQAAAERGILVTPTGYESTPTIEPDLGRYPGERPPPRLGSRFGARRCLANQRRRNLRGKCLD